MKSLLAGCGSICVLAFAASADAMPADAQPQRHARACQPVPASAPWTITFCNPLSRSRGPGAGAGNL